MTIDLKTATSKQLKKHLKDVEKALVGAEKRDRRKAKKAAEAAAAKLGFSLSDLTGQTAVTGTVTVDKPKKQKRRSTGSKSKPKFANPADPKQTWTGRGRPTKWYLHALAKGISPDEMRCDKASNVNQPTMLRAANG